MIHLLRVLLWPAVKFKVNCEANLILAPVSHVVSLLLKVNQFVDVFLKVSFFFITTLYFCSRQITHKVRTSFISKPVVMCSTDEVTWYKKLQN